jgi:hypothetical protein
MIACPKTTEIVRLASIKWNLGTVDSDWSPFPPALATYLIGQSIQF